VTIHLFYRSGRNLAHAAELIIFEGLLGFGAGGHDQGALADDRFGDGFAIHTCRSESVWRGGPRPVSAIPLIIGHKGVVPNHLNSARSSQRFEQPNQCGISRVAHGDDLQASNKIGDVSVLARQVQPSGVGSHPLSYSGQEPLSTIWIAAKQSDPAKVKRASRSSARRRRLKLSERWTVSPAVGLGLIFMLYRQAIARNNSDSTADAKQTFFEAHRRWRRWLSFLPLLTERAALEDNLLRLSSESFVPRATNDKVLYCINNIIIRMHPHFGAEWSHFGPALRQLGEQGGQKEGGLAAPIDSPVGRHSTNRTSAAAGATGGGDKERTCHLHSTNGAGAPYRAQAILLTLCPPLRRPVCLSRNRFT